jgi:hypothetical protein
MSPRKKKTTAPTKKPGPGVDTEAADVAAEGPEDVDKIRDIIFGGQMRDYDKRFSRLEERVLQETSDLRSEITRRLQELEDFVKEEFEEIAGRIAEEQVVRADATKLLSKDLGKLSDRTDKKTAKLDERLAKASSDLRQRILDQSKGLTKELRENYEKLSQLVQEEVDTLQGDKLDRTVLAGLLTEMALRIQEEGAGGEGS